jgi:uncharacterized membrane protein YkoI
MPDEKTVINLSAWIHFQMVKYLRKTSVNSIMKIAHHIGIALIAAMVAGCATEKHKESKEARQAKWMAQAKVSQTEAQATAIAQVPNGAVKDSELEKEHGKLIWSFDIATPDSRDITEVNVDAMTGKVVAMDKEKPEDEAKEAAEEAKKKDKD